MIEKIYYADDDNSYVEFDEDTRYVYFQDGKKKRISKAEWAKYLITSAGDPVEGILIWLDDNEYTHNEEQETLVRETVGQKVDTDKDTSKRKKGSGRKKTLDVDKYELMCAIRSAYNQWKVLDEQFKISNGIYTLTLTKDKKTSAWVKKKIAKPNAEKVEIIQKAVAKLDTMEGVEYLIGNVQKLVYIKYKENTYKLNLVKAKGEKK